MTYLFDEMCPHCDYTNAVNVDDLRDAVNCTIPGKKTIVCANCGKKILCCNLCDADECGHCHLI